VRLVGASAMHSWELGNNPVFQPYTITVRRPGVPFRC